MYPYRWLLFLFVTVMISGLSGNASAIAQTDDDDLPPMIIVTASAIYRWTQADEFVHIADLPAPTYELTPRRSSRVWEYIAISPDLSHVAYSVVTPEWQTVIDENGVDQTVDHLSHNIYLVDIATGQTKPIVLQDTADPRSQTDRWSLVWTPDSQNLIWLEDAEAGNLISYNPATSEFTTLVDHAAPYFSSVNVVTTDRILIDASSADRLTDIYTLYDLNGTVIRQVGTLQSDEAYAYTYRFMENGIDYFGTNLERINLADGDISPTPNGRLLRLATDAPDTSLRVTPATYGDDGCTVDVLSSDGDFVTTLLSDGLIAFSPDGSAILYRDASSYNYTILQIDESGTVSQLVLQRPDGSIYFLKWGADSAILEASDEDFNGIFDCGEG